MDIQDRPQVLVVDDEHTVADSLGMILDISGFQATVCYSGEEAVEVAGTKQFAFLISDVVMDGMNGVDASIAIRELHPKCRILLVSGHNHTAEILRAANGKGHSFEILAKPVHPLVLLASLRNEPRPAMDY